MRSLCWLPRAHCPTQSRNDGTSTDDDEDDDDSSMSEDDNEDDDDDDEGAGDADNAGHHDDHVKMGEYSVQRGHLDTLRNLHIEQSKLMLEQEDIEIARLIAAQPTSPNLPPPSYVPPPALVFFSSAGVSDESSAAAAELAMMSQHHTSHSNSIHSSLLTALASAAGPQSAPHERPSSTSPDVARLLNQAVAHQRSAPPLDAVRPSVYTHADAVVRPTVHPALSS
jgi:hypothetical protein